MNTKPRLYLDGGLEDVQRTVLVTDGPGRVANELSIGTDPMRRRLGVSDGLAAQADLLTLHHKHLGGVTSYHRRLANKLLLSEDVRPENTYVTHRHTLSLRVYSTNSYY